MSLSHQEALHGTLGLITNVWLFVELARHGGQMQNSHFEQLDLPGRHRGVALRSVFFQCFLVGKTLGILLPQHHSLLTLSVKHDLLSCFLCKNRSPTPRAGKVMWHMTHSPLSGEFGFTSCMNLLYSTNTGGVTAVKTCETLCNVQSFDPWTNHWLSWFCRGHNVHNSSRCPLPEMLCIISISKLLHILVKPGICLRSAGLRDLCSNVLHSALRAAQTKMRKRDAAHGENCSFALNLSAQCHGGYSAQAACRLAELWTEPCSTYFHALCCPVVFALMWFLTHMWNVGYMLVSRHMWNVGMVLALVICWQLLFMVLWWTVNDKRCYLLDFSLRL